MLKIITILSALIISTFCLQTGMQVQVSENGVSHIFDQIIDKLNTNQDSIQLPDIKRTMMLFDVSLTGITCNNFNIQDTSLTLSSNSNTQVTAVISDLSASCVSNYNYQGQLWPHLPYGNGKVNLGISHSTAELVIELSKDSNGTPVLTCLSSKFNFDISSINIEGGIGQVILNVFKCLVKYVLTPTMNILAAQMGTDYVNEELNSILQKIPVHFDLGPLANNITGDFSFESINTVNNYANAQIHGEFYQQNSQEEFPYGTPVQLAEMQYTNKFFELQVTTWSINSLFYRVFQEHLLKISILPDMVPSTSPIGLSTWWLQNFAPGIFEAYPYMSMQVDVTNIGRPQISTQNGIIQFEAPFKLAFMVQNNNNTADLIEQFVFSTIIQANLTVELDGSNVIANITDAAFQFTLVRNDTNDTVDVDLFNMFIPSMIPDFLPEINEKLNKEIQLPNIQGFSIINGESHTEDEYFVIAADFSFVPPSFERIKEKYRKLYFSEIKQEKLFLQ